MKFYEHFINVWNNSGDIRFFGYTLIALFAFFCVAFFFEDVVFKGEKDA